MLLSACRAAARGRAAAAGASRALSASAASAASAGGDYDVVVVGGGPGGYVAAIKAAQLGLKTACVEGRGTLGGTCLNVGCIPSKALLHTSHMYHQAKADFAKHGIKIAGDIEIDVPAMIKHKAKAVTGLTKGIEGLFKKNKVTYVKGWGKLNAGNAVSVALNDGGEETLNAKNVILATGSAVANLPGVPIDEEQIVSSTGALELQEVPKRLVVIGGGYIGLEMGSVWSRLGSEVTVVEFLPNIVPTMDGEIRKAFQRSLTKQGMKFKLSTKITGAEKNADGSVRLSMEPSKGGETETMDVDVVLVSVGRTPYTEGLGLEEAGVQLDARGRVQVDGKFQTSVPGVYAIGDIIEGPMLAHKAEEDGIAAVENIAGKVGHVNYDTVPSIVYTHPEVASVGLTEEQVKESGVAYNVGKFPFMANSRAKTNDDFDGMVKFLADKETDKILGVTIMGPNAGELIHECCIAIEYGGASEDIARVCHGHPTLAEVRTRARARLWGVCVRACLWGVCVRACLGRACVPGGFA